MIPITGAIDLFTVTRISYPLICTAVVVLTIRLIRNL